MNLASSLETDAISICIDDIPVKPDLTLASILETNAIFMLYNNAPEQLGLTLAPSFETNAVFILENNEPDLTLASSLKTISSLLLFPITALSYNFYCITGIDFTYHPTLYHSNVTWINPFSIFFRYLILPSI